MYITKKNGIVVLYDTEKIINSILKANGDTNEEEISRATKKRISSQLRIYVNAYMTFSAKGIFRKQPGFIWISINNPLQSKTARQSSGRFFVQNSGATNFRIHPAAR